MQLNEKQYITYRKWKAFCNKMKMVIFYSFPIKRNKIVVCTFEGDGGFGCNPKYIVEELHKRNETYEFVWLVNDMNKEFPDYIIKAPNKGWSRAFHLATAKIWIDNYRKPYGTIKRKGQYYFQTWHGTIGFKSTGLWRGTAFSQMAYMVSKNDSDMIDYVTIDSEWCREMFPKGLVYDGEFLMSGAPRCDVLYGDKRKEKEAFCRKFNLDKNVKLVMFAPTFREKAVEGIRSVFSEEWTIDFQRLINNLEKRFGGDWHLCVRVHPQLATKYSDVWLEKNIINVSQEDDMYEMLAAMDVLITDYSSVAMDASFASIPVFIYADDIEKYIQDRGSFLWNISSNPYDAITNNKLMTPDIDTILPYSIAQDNDELERNILEFDEEEYKNKLKHFEEDVKLVFDGKASSRVADKIVELIQNQ